MLIQDRLTKLRNKRGFTLVELMIVVAIIGVLAALAIYGVRKYLTNAKTAEARMGIGRIAKDAQVAYEKESMDKAAAIPLGETAAIAHRLCGDAPDVPNDKADIKAKKYQSSPGEWNAGGWGCLKFSMSDPQYFQYSYDLVTGDPAVTAVVNDNFQAIAHGDLDGDDNLSTFSLEGKIQTASGETVLTLAPTIAEASAEE